VEALQKIVNEYGLCPQALGLETGQGRCFAHQLRRCKGVCCGEEAPALHRVRVQMALAAQQMQMWPYPGRIGLREHNEATGKTDVHVFDQWCLLATVQDEEQLAELPLREQNLAFDLDTYRLLQKHLRAPAWVRKTHLELIHL
jgi:DNA polymerase-3 subunit epsilon